MAPRHLQAATVAALLAIAALPLTAQAFTYEAATATAEPDAQFTTDGKTYVVSVHKTADKVMIQEKDAKAVGAYDERKKALEGFLFGTGCAMADLQQVGKTGRWEAIFGCPGNVVLQKMMADQKAGLLKGEHLAPVARAGAYLP